MITSLALPIPGSGDIPSLPTPWLPSPATRPYRPRFLDLEQQVGLSSSGRRGSGRRGRRSAPLGPIGLIRNLPAVVPPTPASPGPFDAFPLFLHVLISFRRSSLCHSRERPHYFWYRFP